jgi:alkaline phosphatase D
MKFLATYLSGFFLLLSVHAQPTMSISKIAFGSCSRQSDTLQLWSEILKFNPNVWIWGGDNVYGDTKDMKVLKAKYAEQKNRPSYQTLAESCFITGTWDDHDYGKNDAGKWFRKKKQSKELLLDFLDIPADDPVRKRPGVYSSYTLGEEQRQIKIINLDTRWFRDNLIRKRNGLKKTTRYKTNKRGDVLGKKQWRWLKHELEEATEPLIFINSSIQVIADEQELEKWGNFPKARKRFLDLVIQSQKNVIILSGDQHISEISKLEIPGRALPLFDITSSGLTHVKNSSREIFNRYRIGHVITQKNFGLMEIDWSGEFPKVQVSIRGHHSQLFLALQISFDPADNVTPDLSRPTFE